MSYQMVRWMLNHWLISSIHSCRCVINANYIDSFCNLNICPAGTNKLQINSMHNINQLVIVDLANSKSLSRHHILYRSMRNLHHRIPLFGRSPATVRPLQLVLRQGTVWSLILLLMLKGSLRLFYIPTQTCTRLFS